MRRKRTVRVHKRRQLDYGGEESYSSDEDQSFSESTSASSSSSSDEEKRRVRAERKRSKIDAQTLGAASALLAVAQSNDVTVHLPIDYVCANHPRPQEYDHLQLKTFRADVGIPKGWWVCFLSS